MVDKDQQLIHLRVPRKLYDQIQQVADVTGQKVNTVINDRLESTFPVAPDTTPEELESALLRAARVNYSNSTFSSANAISASTSADNLSSPVFGVSVYEATMNLLSQSQEPQED